MFWNPTEKLSSLQNVLRRIAHVLSKMRKIATLLLTVALLVCAIPVLTAPAMSATAGSQGFQGTVVNETGAPMSGVTITCVNTTTNTTLTVLTNEQGLFGLTTPTGTYNVTATITNFNPNNTYANIVIRTGSSVRLNITMLEILGSVHGFVTDGSAPVNGVTVVLINDERSYNTTTVAPLGEYRLDGIRPGVYVATYEKKGYERTNSLPLDIVRGVTTQSNASMQAQPCKLFGQVNENGAPLEGVTVTATGQDRVVVGTTDSNGNYSIQLTSDSYTVVFGKKGYDSKDLSISLAPFEDRHLDISIIRSKSNNTATFLFGFDLPHSLMVVGLMLALITICVGLFINFKVRKRPELLVRDPQEEEKKED